MITNVLPRFYESQCSMICITNSLWKHDKLIVLSLWRKHIHAIHKKWAYLRPEIFRQYYLHRVSKSPTYDLLRPSHTRSDYDNFWQKSYWESTKSCDALFSHLTYLVLLHYLRNRKPRRQRSGALCMQHSPTAAALSTFLSPEPRPRQSL